MRSGKHLTDAEESRQLSRLVSLSVRLFGIHSRRFSSLLPSQISKRPILEIEDRQVKKSLTYLALSLINSFHSLA